MLSLISFFLLISSGSVFAAVYWKRSYGDMVPLTIFCIVEVIFLFGLINHLRMGVYAACTVCVILYILAIWRMIQDRSYSETLSLLLTPAFFIFLVVLIIYAFSIVGWVASQTDSYYFWALSTKQMWYADTFHCLPGLKTIFAEYPPGLGLFELFLITLKGSFSEWHMIFAYSTMIFSLHLPFLKNSSGKSLIQELLFAILIGLVILLSGSIFYPDSLACQYADLPLGAVFAYGMARIFFLKKDEHWSLLDIFDIIMSANMVVLIKSAGKLFAVLMIATLIYVILSKNNRKEWRTITTSRQTILKGFLVLVPFATALLWKIKYTRYNEHVYFNTSNYDLREFFQILAGKVDAGYRVSIKDSFIDFLNNQTIGVGFLNLTNLQAVLILAAVTVLLTYAFRKKSTCCRYSPIIVLYAGVLIYWIGLMASYMYTFMEVEGVALASMQRYLNIYHTALVLFLVYLLFTYISQSNVNKLLSSFTLLLLLCFCSLPSLTNLLTGKWVEVANSGVREELAPIVEFFQRERERERIQDIVPQVMVIDQAGYGYAVILDYILFPQYSFPWICSFGSVPIATSICTAEEFNEFIRSRDYAYIVIRMLDEDFVNTYGSLFDTPLENGQVYQVREKSELYTLIKPAEAQ